MKTLLLSLVAAGFACGQSEPTTTPYARSWTSNNGKEISARLLGMTAGQAALQLETGKVVQIQPTRLSTEDQAFLKTHSWPLPPKWKGWPTDLQVTLASIKIEDEGQKEKWFTYHSDHFEIAAEAQLGSTCVRQICRLLEGVYLLMEKSPWGILAEPKNERFRIELYQTEENYVKNGGPADSLGVYLTDRAVFMVPFESLGITKGSSGWRQERDASSKTIVHELTHMLMADALSFLPPWLIEGVAEYMELIPLRTSVFRPNSLQSELRDHNTFMSSRVRGGHAASLKDVFGYNLYEWQSGGLSRDAVPSSNRRRSSVKPVTGFYHTGLLLTYYYIHLDGDGDAARLQRFIAASKASEKQLEAFQVQLDKYKKEREDYDKAWDALEAHPDAIEVSPGEFKFPPSLKAPKAPVLPDYPFGDPDEEHIRFAKLDVLLEGQTTENALNTAYQALNALKLKLQR